MNDDKRRANWLEDWKNYRPKGQKTQEPPKPREKDSPKNLTKARLKHDAVQRWQSVNRQWD